MTAFEPTFCGLMPHPPIIVPSVGGDRHAECRATYDACRLFARRLMGSKPRRLFLVSPHSPRRQRSFGLWGGERLRGDLARFGAAGARVDLANDPEQLAALEAALKAEGLECWTIPPHGHEPGLDQGAFLDHGAVIPLWFLQQAGWEGPTVVASLPWQCEPEHLETFGRALSSALDALAEPTAVVASGDMSHRLLPGAPAGYDPKAIEFDHQLTDLAGRGALDRFASIDSTLREQAAEDAADTCILVASALGNRPRGAEVLSYEHPFGVGYLVAIFWDATV